MEIKKMAPPIKKTCEICGKDFMVKFARAQMGRGRFCSKECLNKDYEIRKNNRHCFMCKDSEEIMNQSGRFFHSNGYCNICSSNYSKERRLDPAKHENLTKVRRRYASINRKKLNSNQAELSRKLKIEVINHYGGSCACCGESNILFLCIDHAHGRGQEHRNKIGVHGSRIYQWLRIQEYPEGFRVLCYNCNMSLSCYGYCPHGNIKVKDPEKAPYLIE
jgi:hypothetical protein